MRKRGYWVLLVLLVILVQLLCSCTSKMVYRERDKQTEEQQETLPKQDGEWVFGSSPLAFSFYVNYDWYAPKGYGMTQATKWLKEKMKLSVTEIGSNGNAAQKFGTMVVSGDLPDLIQMDMDDKFDSLIRMGKLVPLDDFINNPAYPNFKRLADSRILEMARRNGKIYGLPNWFGQKMEKPSNNKGWIVNRKIYKALGSPKLETFEDLYSYLRSVKDRYPDVIPLDTANTNGGVVQVQNFLYAGAGENRTIFNAKSDGTFAYPDYDKKEFRSIFKDPAFIESYLWTSRYFREKLLTQDTFTQKLEQFKEKLISGKIAVAAVYDVTRHGEEANNILKAKDPEAGYDYIPYIHGKGVDPGRIVAEIWGEIGWWNVNCITTSAREPEKIFAFLDWAMSDDGIRFLCYGPRGIFWDESDAEGAPVPNERFKKTASDERAALKLGEWTPQGSWRMSEITAARNNQDPGLESWGTKAGLFYGKWIRYTDGNELDGTGSFPPNSDEEDIWRNIKQINNQYAAKVTFAENDDAALKQLEAWEKAVMDAGYDKLLKYRTRIWKENVKKLEKK